MFIFLFGEQIKKIFYILSLTSVFIVTAVCCLSARAERDKTSNEVKIRHLLRLQDEQINKENYEEAIKLADSSIFIAKSTKSRAYLDRILLNRSIALVRLNLIEEAFSDLYSAEYFTRKINPDSASTFSSIYFYLGYCHIVNNSSIDSVSYYYRKANSLLGKTGDNITQFKNLEYITILVLYFLPKTPFLDELFNDAVYQAKRIDNIIIIEDYFNLVNYYRTYKYFAKADSLLNVKEFSRLVGQSNSKDIDQEYHMYHALINWSKKKYYEGILFSIKAIEINPNPKTKRGLLNITYCYDLLAITYGRIKMFDSALANFDKAIAFANLAYEQTEEIGIRFRIKASIIRFNMHKALLHNFMKDYKKVDEICLSIDKTIQKDLDLFINDTEGLLTILLFYVNYFEMLYDRKLDPKLDEIIKKIDFLFQKSNKFQANLLLKWYYHYINGNYLYLLKNYQAAIQNFRFAEQIIGDEKLDDDIYYRFFKMYSSALAKINDYKNAYYIAEKYLTYKSKADYETEIINLDYIKAWRKSSLENEESRRQLDLETAQNKTNKIILIIFALVFIFLAILIAIIMKERSKSEKLLLSILPKQIAIRLKAKEKYIADKFYEASIMFIDMASFTQMGAHISPEQLVEVLNDIFTLFDNISEKYGLEKIKTIGDCYLAVAGLPQPRIDHAEITADMALEVMDTTKDFKTKDGEKINFRIGIDCGPVVAGIIGEKKFIYDLWGDTVNTASRMEDYGVSGEIQITDRFKKKLESMGEEVKSKYAFVNRGKIELKGKGKFQAWFLKRNIKSQVNV